MLKLTRDETTSSRYGTQVLFLLLSAVVLLFLGTTTTTSFKSTDVTRSLFDWVANTSALYYPAVSLDNNINNNSSFNISIASDEASVLKDNIHSSYEPLYDKFNGTTIHSPFPGIDVYSYVCVEEAPWKYYIYGNENDFTAKNHIHRPLETWPQDTHPDNCTFVDAPTLFFKDMVIRPHGNPAHCLNDMVFALTYQHPQDSNITATFPSYMYGGSWRLPSVLKPECDETLSWCCNVMKRAGWIPKHDPPVYPTNDNTRRMCFKSLVMPNNEAFRHKPDPESLAVLQQRILKSGQLPETKWTKAELAATPQHIFLYDRHGSRRRMYNNSGDFVGYLESNYQVVVNRVGQEWNVFKPAAQAAMYNAYPNIIAPHGAHLANLVYVRPGTRVIEMQCEIHGNAAIQNRSTAPLLDANGKTLTRKEDLLWFGKPAFHREGHTSWHISLSDNLDMQHFVYVEKEGCKDANGNLDRGYSPLKFNVDPVEFGEYVAARFKLQKKK